MVKLAVKSASVVALCIGLVACGSSKDNVTGEVDGNLAPMSEAPEGTVAPPPQQQQQALNVGDRTLSAPTDFLVAVAFYNIVGLAPPFNDWARADPRARNANEFDRAEIAGRIQQELLIAARAAAGIGFIEVNTDSSFGEYDMAAQGFRLNALDSDRFYSWHYNGNRYRLTMENGNQAQLWRIPQDEARALIESGGSRNVDLKLRFRVVGAIPEGSGGGTLQGRIVGYEVLDRNGRKVGEAAFQ